jgi:hypothetical protein
MNRLLSTVIIALVLSVVASAQNAKPDASNPAHPTPVPQADKQGNAASAAHDTEISGDQVTKPAGAKTSTVIGCLGGPDADGHFVLTSMQYRFGVDVLGPDDLATAAGSKVKLTGQWVPGADSPDESSKKKNRRFQATSFDIMDDKCSLPAETTPISKKKQQQQKAAASQSAGNNPK